MTEFKFGPCLFIFLLIRHAKGTIPAESSSAATSSKCYGDNLDPVCLSGSQIAITSYYDGFKAASLNCPIDGTATGNCCTYDTSGDCLQENPTESRYMDALSGRDSGVIATSSVLPTSGWTCDSGSYSMTSVFSQLNYHCIPDDRIYSMCSTVITNNSSLPLYLQNRNYPDGILNTDTSCMCSVLAMSGGDINMYIVHMDLYDTQGNCQQTLTVKDVNSNVLRTYNCDNKEFNVIKNETIATNYAEIELINNFEIVNAGKFWLGFKGADIVVSCPPIDCGVPTQIESGSVNYTLTRYGRSAIYSCNKGYNMTSGDDVIYCSVDGNWNGTVPVCTPVGTIPAESSTAVTSSECYGNNIALVCPTRSQIAITSYYDGFKAALHRCPLDGTANGTCCTYDVSGDCLQDNPTESRYVDALSGRDSGVISTSSVLPTSGGLCDSNSFSVVSVFTQLNYHCIPDTRIIQLCTSTTSNHTLPLYLKNQNYPDGIPITDNGCTCSVEALSGGSIDLYIVHMDLYDTPGACLQTLIVRDVDGNILRTFNCDNEEFNVIKTEIITNNYIVIELINDYTTSNAGKFWLGFLASDPGSEIKITCPPDSKDCGDPTPTNGNAGGSNFTYNFTVTITCNTGFTLTGSENITCLDDGQWSETVTCDPINCGAPSLINGDANTPMGTTYGNTALLTCDTGYTLVGNNTAWCREDGVWNYTASCEIKDCGNFSVTNGIVSAPLETEYDVLAVVDCNRGYRINGDSLVTCQNNGTWSERPTCDIIDCGDPTPTNGSVDGTVFTYNSIVTITCNTGFTLSGSENITCLDDGQWSETVTCNTIDCGTTRLMNGDANTLMGTTYGNTALLTCDTGYTLVGDNRAWCGDSGVWNYTAYCEIKDCGDPTPPNGGAITPRGTTFGELGLVTCDPGYSLQGNALIACQENGTWSSNTSCLIFDCGTLENPLNGAVSTSGTSSGSIATYTCDVGYMLSGVFTRTCVYLYGWDAREPTCDVSSSDTDNSSNGFTSTDENTLLGVAIGIGLGVPVLSFVVMGIFIKILLKKKARITPLQKNRIENDVFGTSNIEYLQTPPLSDTLSGSTPKTTGQDHEPTGHRMLDRDMATLLM